MPVRVQPQPSLKPLWAYKGISATGGTPLITPDRIVCLTADKYDVVALDLAGKRIWSFPGEAALGGVAGGDLLVYSAARKQERFVLLDVLTGRERHHTVNQNNNNLIAVLGGDQRFLEAWYPEPTVRLRRLDKDFPPVWTRSMADDVDPAQQRLDHAVACDSERCFLAIHRSNDNMATEIAALATKTGELLWRRSLSEIDRPAPPIEWRPRIVNGLLVLSTYAGTAALHVSTGRLKWHVPVAGTRTIVDGRVYVHSMGSGSGLPTAVTALDLKDGRCVWRREYPEILAKNSARLSGHFAFMDPHLFCADDDGRLWGLSRDAGVPVWSEHPKGADAFAPWCTPIVAGRRLYIISSGRRPSLYCYEYPGAAGLRVDPSLEEERESVPQIAFEIVDVRRRQALVNRAPFHERGGAWLVLECRTDAGVRFFLGACFGSDETLSAGDGAIWVPTGKDGSELLAYVRTRFGGGKGKPTPARRPRSPVRLSVVVLGHDERVRTKWTGPGDSPEFYVEWSIAERRGVITEKDESDRPSVVKMFASLVSRS